ncbi:hypothetical protein HX045_10760 [Myroides odoratimimus]|uniref:Uncharacterized protein n=1 Tax=Myroides odoratimimus CCUG 10230 TaxID=883150 RepID=A0ABN0EEK2_9FLAO|nr:MULTISPECIES: hypothetical protein [Myroides]AJA68999.1 hypothetical protein MYRA21_1857 [Myroides sp. A21]EHO12283.1 hypothetical protein HMPREF9712_00530 [Myroides odoratimimus CCUG 10230]EHO13750.1 hypothetical protein HMPREF9714_00749 [Myroides odoratimimus CCUG 12901]MCA4793581.1 hypothetical protein [Myroides odoratimimus]MCA4807765.1 hypothetical protein [Myroides odoratimimus]
MKKIFSCLIVALVGFLGYAQEPSKTIDQKKETVVKDEPIVIKDTLRLKFQNNENVGKDQQFLGKDIYESTYLKEGDVFRKNTKYSGTSYKSKNFDSLTLIDITNPLELMLFYKEKKAFVLVNRELAERNVIELGVKFPTMETSFAGVSTKRNYWLVNERNRSVNLYNSVTYELHRVFTFPEGVKIKQYLTLPHLFFWVDEENVLHGNDLVGKEIVTYNLESEYDLMQILEVDKLLYSYKDKLYFVDLKANKTSVLDTKEKSISGFFYGNQKLSIFDGQKLNNYFIKLP